MGKIHPSIGAGYRTPLISDVDRLLSAPSNVRNGSTGLIGGRRRLLPAISVAGVIHVALVSTSG
jgi:hypothetical protein